MSQRRKRAGLRGRDRWGPVAPAGRTPATARGGRWPWVALAVLLVLLLPVGYFGYGLVTTLFTVSQPGAGPIGGGPSDIHGTVNVLLMGSDERRDKNGHILAGDVPHSDTMILVALDTDRHEVRMLSVPRDLLVEIPGYGAGHRINEAYTIGEVKHLPGGGPVLAVKTMEKLTGLQVPYYAVTTFDGFRQTVDAVGGVVIDVERPITDHDYPGQGDAYMPVYVPAGRQLLDGERALEYVRSRHDDPLGDFGRNKRQQHLLSALGRELLVPGRITQLNQFLQIARDSFRTNLSPAQILALGRTMVTAGKGHVQSYTVGLNETRDPTPREFAAYGAVKIPDSAAIDRVVRAFRNGDPMPQASPAAA